MAGHMGYGAPEAPPPDKPQSFFLYSTLVTIFCCAPFGIVAMVFGVLVLVRNRSGDTPGAKHASDLAEKWMYAACGAGFLLFLAYLIFRVVGRFTTGHF